MSAEVQDPMRNRSTKIVATLGPASSSPEVLERMFRAGVDVVRMNFSHGTRRRPPRRAPSWCASCAARLGRTVGIMADLQGPKIRIGKFKDGKVTLKTGDRFILDAECALGDETRVGLDYKELPHDVKPGDVLLLDDGKIVLDVEQVSRRAGPPRPCATAACSRTTRASTGSAAA